jgi:hypothetical protein
VSKPGPEHTDWFAKASPYIICMLQSSSFIAAGISLTAGGIDELESGGEFFAATIIHKS